MHTSRSSAELGARIYKRATVLERASRDSVFAAALVTKEAMLEGSSSVGLSPGTLVGRDRKKPARFGAGFDVVGRSNFYALVRYRPARFAAMFNRGAPAHKIQRRRRGKAFRFGSGEGAEFVPAKDGIDHPGFSPRPFWATTKVQARLRARRAITATISAAMRLPI